LPRRLSAEALA